MYALPMSLLPSLKPQVRWIPEIAGQAARVGTLALLGYTGYQAFADGYSLAEAAVTQTALLLGSPLLAARWNSTGAKGLATRALWNPIQREKLRDTDQVINKAVLGSLDARNAVDKASPGTIDRFYAYMAGMKRKSLAEGLLYGGLGVFLTGYYLNQFG